MDQDGTCQFASVLNVARRANVNVEEATAALKVLESPDPHSSDSDNDGRRIERVPGGWIVLNATKYRAIVSASESRRLAKERAQRYRDKRKKNVTKRDETAERNAPVTQSEAEAEADAVSLKGTTLEERDESRPSSVPGWTTRLRVRFHERIRPKALAKVVRRDRSNKPKRETRLNTINTAVAATYLSPTSTQRYAVRPASIPQEIRACRAAICDILRVAVSR